MLESLSFDHSKLVVRKDLDVGVVYQSFGKTVCKFCPSKKKCWHIKYIEELDPNHECDDENVDIALEKLRNIESAARQVCPIESEIGNSLPFKFSYRLHPLNTFIQEYSS